jgi:hypothetical protein
MIRRRWLDPLSAKRLTMEENKPTDAVGIEAEESAEAEESE